jgi:hypothetical protein
MRAVHTLMLLALASAPALAQNTSQNANQGNTDGREQLSKQEQPANRLNQRTERIRVEDGGSRIDELRVGGQTQLRGIEGGIENTNYFLTSDQGEFVLTLFERLTAEPSCRSICT